jgi:outer membrane immunogenic protein
MPFAVKNLPCDSDGRECIMHKALIGIAAAVALIGTPALAADMPLKAPPAPPPPAWSWTGFYVGGNVGYSWGGRNDIAGNGSDISFPALIPVPNAFAFAGSQASRINGAIGGAQFGYNYQFDPRWVLGFETDIQASGERANNTAAAPFSGAVCTTASNPPPTCVATTPFSAAATTAYQAKIDWFGTVRGRLGYLVNDQLLLYGTGGLAYGQVSASGITSVNGAALGFAPFAPGTSAFSASSTRVGYTVGAGIEDKLSSNWTWKLEYLYVDLGSLGAAAPFPGATPIAGETTITGTMNAKTHFNDNILRVGLNYQFH